MINSKVKKYDIIALLSVKNEEWIIERWLERTSEIVDGIIILDDGSTDKTPAIIKSHPKVIKVITNPVGKGWKVLDNRRTLLSAAKSYKPNWILIIDADEILDKRLESNLESLISDPETSRIYFKEITLWKDTKSYRIDKPELYSRSTGTCQLLRMNSNLEWTLPAKHKWKRRLFNSLKEFKLLKAPASGYEKMNGIIGNTIHSDFVRIHYHFVDWEQTWYKHMRYAVREAIQFNKSLDDLEEICKWATSRLDESTLKTSPIKPEWGVLD